MRWYPGKISKSGINHRLRKIDDIAEKLRAGETIAKNKRLKGNGAVVQKQVKVSLKNGLQARPAALFVQEANRFHADIFIEKDGKTVNAKSIMGIMSLAIGTGSMITITTEGSDAEEALEALAAYVQ